VISEVEALAADERGLALGLLIGAGGVNAAGRLAGPGADRCRAALETLATLSEEARVAEGAALAAALEAPVPDGIEHMHPGWIRRALEAEPSELLRAVTRGMPAEVRRVADELLAARGEAPRERARLPEGPGLAGVRRTLFAGLAPMPTAGGRDLPRARALCALTSAALIDEIDRRGATTLGAALAGAPDAVVARAAAGAGEPFARIVLAAAKSPSVPEERARARALLAELPASEAARGAVRAAGLRAVAREVAAEGGAAVAAVAQRLPPALGDVLLACALPAASEAAP
jgi:hypothetical protein